MALKKGGQVGLIVVVLAAVFVAVKHFVIDAPKAVEQIKQVSAISLPDVPNASLTGNSDKLPLPSTAEALNGGTRANIYEMTWAAQTSLNYANGGPRTTKGSLLDKAGWDVTLIRQDDDGQTQTDMIKWIKDYHDGKTTDGYFLIDMGSQMDWYIGAINNAVKDLGDNYKVEIFDAVGKSYGEDQLIAKPEIFNDIKANPQLLKGKVVRGVRLGGDLDIAIKFARDNGVGVNPDDRYYFPDQLNLSYSKDFLSAVVDYNSGQKETRKLVVNGKTSSKDTSVGYDLVATWFPGDYNATLGPGAAGGGTLISTHQYASIMPAVVIGCKKYLQDNFDKVKAFIAAHTAAADQVRSFKDVKSYALSLDAQIWKEKDGPYWEMYFDGKKQGNAVLGGSSVYNLNDIITEFGLQSNTDIYKEVYKTFYDVHANYYPPEMKTAPDYSHAVDKSFMLGVVSDPDASANLLKGKALKVDYTAPITTKVASKSVQINFAVGSDVIQPSSFLLLDKIAEDLIASDGLKAGVYGHTDNTGNPDANVELSTRRANSVKLYLLSKKVPQERLEAQGFGQTQPLNPEDNQNLPTVRAKNRRVEIALGN